MEFENIYDMHTHSDNSFDGNHSCILLCEGAAENSCKGIAITDHCDIDAKDYDFRAFALNQFVEANLAKAFFKDRLDVLVGIELGQGIYKKEKSLEILKEFDYDFVLGSIHNLEDKEDFYYLNYEEYDVKSLMRNYFEAVLALSQWNKTDSIAHLTYPLRYLSKYKSIKFDISDYYDIIDAIFETIIKNDKALELNVSGLFNGLNDTLPNKELIKRFHDMGGKYVTVGSDSHYYNKVSLGIKEGYNILLECGFEQFTIFKKREPILMNIE